MSRAHYSEVALKDTRFFVRTDEHIFPLDWWTTRFHHCKSLIENRDKFPHHVVDVRELTERIAAELAEKDRDYVIIDAPNLGMFRASPAAVSASLAGEKWALFCEVCAHVGGISGWVNAWFVGDDLEPRWVGKPMGLQPEVLQ